MAPQSCSCGSCGKGLPSSLLDHGLVRLATSFSQILGGQLGVEIDAAVAPSGRSSISSKWCVVDAEHDVAVHLDEAAVAVVGEARDRRVRLARPSTVSSLRPRLRTVSIMPGIETRAPERTETSSGLAASPNLRADRLLDLAPERCAHWLVELGRIGLAVGVVVGADLGGDGEARAAPAGRGSTSRPDWRPCRRGDCSSRRGRRRLPPPKL